MACASAPAGSSVSVGGLQTELGSPTPKVRVQEPNLGRRRRSFPCIGGSNWEGALRFPSSFRPLSALLGARASSRAKRSLYSSPADLRRLKVNVPRLAKLLSVFTRQPSSVEVGVAFQDFIGCLAVPALSFVHQNSVPLVSIERKRKIPAVVRDFYDFQARGAIVKNVAVAIDQVG